MSSSGESTWRASTSTETAAGLAPRAGGPNPMPTTAASTGRTPPNRPRRTPRTRRRGPPSLPPTICSAGTTKSFGNQDSWMTGDFRGRSRPAPMGATPLRRPARIWEPVWPSVSSIWLPPSKPSGVICWRDRWTTTPTRPTTRTTRSAPRSSRSTTATGRWSSIPRKPWPGAISWRSPGTASTTPSQTIPTRWRVVAWTRRCRG
mmetsp:Transcript_25370/g.59416  ORF Transcript_25370/g.59416 Transcript_25370/m.59416 type:complete len:204 (-) Transcript_25370:1014-1625(-)